MSNTEMSYVLSIGILDLTNGFERIQLLGSSSELARSHPPSRPSECDIRFILGASSRYALQSNSYLTIFLDAHDQQRHLPAERYQVRCQRSCNAADFALWANQLITALATPFSQQALLCTDLADLRIALHSARSRSLIARSFRVTDEVFASQTE